MKDAKHQRAQTYVVKAGDASAEDDAALLTQLEGDRTTLAEAKAAEIRVRIAGTSVPLRRTTQAFRDSVQMFSIFCSSDTM